MVLYLNYVVILCLIRRINSVQKLPPPRLCKIYARLIESARDMRSSLHCSVVCLNECLSSVLQYRRDMTLTHSLLHSLVSTVCAL